MNGKTRLWFVGVAGCLILAAAWALVIQSGPAIANPPPHDHGGGDDGGKTVVIHGCITFDDGEGDSVKSDNGSPYCDSIDSSIALLEFFRFHVELPKKGTGRTLSLDFDEFPLDSNELPADEKFWTLAISGHHLDEWRLISEGSSVDWDGRLRFGKEPHDVLVILYGTFGGIDYGDPLTVTRTAEDVWTIEGNFAEVARQGNGNANFDVLGSGSVPFKVTYDGTQ